MIRRRSVLVVMAAATLVVSLVSAANAAAPAGSRTTTRAVSPAAASAMWALQHPANGPLAQGSLAADSCVSAKDCVAVGNYVSNTGAQSPLVEDWNGKSWKLHSAPAPKGVAASLLAAVSCPAKNACVAVGQSTPNSGGGHALIEMWNGKKWAIRTTPKPKHAGSSFLFGVSCVTSRECTAVGSYASGDVSLALVVAWNGKKWSVESTPKPKGAEQVFLEGVSCPVRNACSAVGYYATPSTDRSLTEQWNGKAWSIHASPIAKGDGAGAYLLGVSCTSKKSCVAAGYYDKYANSSGVYEGLVEVWNGKKWASRTSPSPEDVFFTELKAISCAASRACTAVGIYQDTSGTTLTLAETWNGNTWAIRATPNSKSATFGQLSGVSCTKPTICGAVGYDVASAGPDHTLAQESKGAHWSMKRVANPIGAAQSFLSDISCTSTCVAVGYYENSAGAYLTLAETWNGKTWSRQPTPNVSGATVNQLTGVSCLSAKACTAVGADQNSSGTERTLIERWNGKTWSIQAAPNAGGDTVNALTQVSCTAAKSCMAVGTSGTGEFDLSTLAESWNGTSWSITTTPNPSGATVSDLNAVSCTGAGAACTAVGEANGASGGFTLAERWNGASWKIQTTPNPSGQESRLNGVSCLSATDCRAVGDGANGSIAEIWNGTTWSLQSAATLSGYILGLAGVECSAANACIAVGNRGVGSAGSEAVAETWNGTKWSIQKTPSPGRYNNLGAVSCPPGHGACEAVGDYQDPNTGNYFALAETP